MTRGSPCRAWTHSPNPCRLDEIKAEVQRRWGTLDLLDVLKDSDFLCELTNKFASSASREVIDQQPAPPVVVGVVRARHEHGH